MVADLADIHQNNKIRMPNYSKQSCVNTSRNSSRDGFRFPSRCNPGSVTQVKSRMSYSQENSLVRGFNENQDQKQIVYGIPRETRRTEATRPRGSERISPPLAGTYTSGASAIVKRCHSCNCN